ncbi:YhaN family protein [Methylobacterium sp. Leaf108]|uniref:ATP-binding protein n=1 Tax=Methylobacterium sp. Leaf108 TaxID=1736256 RepID=UPI0006F3B100|nr:YhaN family protein [Methylobacterium sp. Leaf108]KQP61663.1 chromosome segregation protein SMC [Methylobacterium sp. Leaf108]
MRLLSLDLERYGPFSGRRLAFRPDARLHVVLGPNEAGKSTALAAVTDLLFGIEARTRFAFLHEMKTLRLGAEIEAADGRRLAFRRRKGNSGTLVDAADAALPEDALVPFLGGLTRDVFCRAFGLDAASLRQGGREMLTSDGEVGASLFAAASGLRGYHDLQKGLGTEADAIFAPRRSKDRTFYQALDRHEAARRAIRETELRAGDWRALNDEIEAAASRLDAIRDAREAIARERARLERLKRVAPLVAAIDAISAEAEADPDLVEASPDWIDRLGDALSALRSAGAEQARARTALAHASADRDAVTVEAGVIARDQDILERFRGIDRFDKDGVDLTRIQADTDRAAADLDRLAIRVGLPDRAALSARQPSDAARARIDALVREGREREATLTRLRRDLAAATAEEADLARAVEAEGVVVDPGPLRAAFKVLAPLREDLARRDALDAAVRHEARLLAGQAARLSPAVTDPAALVDAPLPQPETVARFRTLMEAKERERLRASDALATARKAVAATRTRLLRREAGRPIPSLVDLSALRQERDDLFAPLRAGTAGADPIARYERAVAAADRMADDLALDAARVAEQAADHRRLAAEEEEEAGARASLDEIAAEASQALDNWRAAWAPAGILPLPPAEMAVWLGEAVNLIEGQQVLESRQNEIAALSRRIEACRTPLVDLAARAGLSGLDTLPPALLLARLDDRITELAGLWEAGREAKARLRAAATQRARLGDALGEADAGRTAWAAGWGEAVAAVGLTATASLAEAEGAFEAWRAVPLALDAHDTLARRVAGIRRDRETYAATVAELLAAVALDLSEMAPSAAIRSLHGRLQQARDAQARRTALTRHCDEAARRVEIANADLARAEVALTGHLAGYRPDLGADAVPAIEILQGRLLARARLRADLAARRAELTRAADGLPEASLRDDLVATSPDAIEAALARIAMEDEAHDQEGRVVFADRDRGERRRQELEGGTGAELAVAQRKAAEAELQVHARQWAVLKLAHLMLGTAIGRHRAGQQDPLLSRAGDLFSGLTGGAFAGLAQEYDEADTPRLTGRRADGGSVPVEGLSEGTRDQLYLALRLAYLQDYAARGEPAPFIGDDLFITFDDARTGHGLEALAAVGGTIQPILFTHHAHVADLARARLGDGVDVVTM